MLTKELSGKKKDESKVILRHFYLILKKLSDF